MIWWLAFEENPFQFWGEIWILYLSTKIMRQIQRPKYRWLKISHLSTSHNINFFLFQVPNGPIFDIFPSFGQHLHLGFDEFGPISGRSVRNRIHDLANWRKLQNCNCSNLDNLRIFLHTSHIFTWGSSAGRRIVLLWVYEQPNHTVFTRGLGYEMEFSSLYGKSYKYIDLVLLLFLIKMMANVFSWNIK